MELPEISIAKQSAAKPDAPQPEVQIKLRDEATPSAAAKPEASVKPSLPPKSAPPAKTSPASAPPPAAGSSGATKQATPLKLSPEERAKLRTKVRVGIALFSSLVLLITYLLLLAFS